MFFDNIDLTQPILVTRDQETLTILGWALDSINQQLAGGVVIEIGGIDYPAVYGTNRHDVSEHFGNPDYRLCGFEVAIPVKDLKPGIHRLSIKILSLDRKAYYTPETAINLEIR